MRAAELEQGGADRCSVRVVQHYVGAMLGGGVSEMQGGQTERQGAYC